MTSQRSSIIRSLAPLLDHAARARGLRLLADSLLGLAYIDSALGSVLPLGGPEPPIGGEGFRPPGLRILYAEAWSRELGNDAAVFLQAFENMLYLRVQAHAPMDGLMLGGPSGVSVLERVPSGEGPFALNYLNGGGLWGSLWVCSDRAADEVFPHSPGPWELVLMRADRRTRLGELLPGWDPDGELPGASASGLGYACRTAAMEDQSRQLGLAIRAYTMGDPGGFAAALKHLSVYRGQARRLSLMEALWLGAMVAELRRADSLGGWRGALLQTWGCNALDGHPQILAPSGAVRS